jgi:cytochrome oxidase Cu insertion factor (SCO1/SenC/PrrC family)
VLTFFNAPCNDICPVLASEIEQADANLGAQAGDVEFVTVNTDPSALAASAETPAVNGTGLGALPNWHMVTGPLTSLNPLWKAYGVSITLETKTGLEAHNDVMDFLDPQGIVRYRATPIADESSTGAYTLPAPSEARWAQGIAMYAARLDRP